ncbi:hypothetical protein [Mucilaginibacter sp. UYCu711]|uniref:hypothetical protein n=1 Tax=Mucilaginibacter sp. UYCu711 TaxID=3156339 RepID=UPI003D1999B1
MAFQTLSSYQEEQHPWPPYVPKGATKLLLGTFPTVAENHRFEFFYPSPKNRFWPVMSALAECPLTHFAGQEAVRERREILQELRLAVTDIGLRVLRQNESALDHNLFPLEFFDVFALIEANPSIDTIILTSSGKGNSVLTWFSAYCELNTITFKHLDENIPWETNIRVNKRDLKIVVAYSTSSIYRRLDIPKLIEHYRPILTQ